MVSLPQALEKVELVINSTSKAAVKTRPFLRLSAEQLEAALSQQEGTAVFLSAPTGYGKTSLSMSIAYKEYMEGYKAIISYPLRTLIEDQYVKFRDFFTALGMPEAVGRRMMGVRESPYLVHPVVLTTIDTLSLVAVGLSPEDIASVSRDRSLGHFLFSWGAAWLSKMVFDEVHLMFDESKSLGLLVAFLKLGLNVFGAKMVFLSATMPQAHLKTIRNALGESREKVKELKFSEEYDREFVDDRRSKEYRINLLSLTSENKFEELEKRLSESKFTRALVVFNTVEDAVAFYQRINYPLKLLLHSRFSEEDKKEKFETLKRLSSNGSKFVLVATQTVEAGVDVSSDLIITELAPASSLVQRFGRFLRRPGERCVDPENCAYVWYEEDQLDIDKQVYKVYQADLCKNTLSFLDQKPDLNLHIDYDVFLDGVYRESDARFSVSYVRKIIDVYNNLLNPTKRVIELLIQHEGSLLRSGALFRAETTDGVVVPVDYNLLWRHCVGDCPKTMNEAIERSLADMGEGPAPFKIKCTYNRELGLVC
ncbi:MAG: CRISPR-associated helicase Cas3' [Infirmifilum sp.]